MDTVLSSITCRSLRAVLGSPSAPVVIDVRKPAAFAADPRLVPGALRRPHDAVTAWASSLDRQRIIVTYCVHGHEVSQGAARELCALGFDARYLEGGFEAWIDASLPTTEWPDEPHARNPEANDR